MKQTVLVFGGLVTALLIFFQIGRYSIISGDIKTELLIGLTALVFLGVGLLVRRSQTSVSQPMVAPAGLTPADLAIKLKELQITDREFEVLGHITSGLSNKEIADQLFLSESTIKTHVSNLLNKLNARRRTQAVERARSMGILA